MKNDDQRPTVPSRAVVTLPATLERDRVIAALSDAFAHDALDVDEFERRVTLAQVSNSRSELEALVHDLPSTALQAAPAPQALVPANSVRETERLMAVMGGIDRRGPWNVPRRMKVLAMMGGGRLDFREAHLPAGEIELDITALMGGIEIIVPPTLAVEATGSAIMGGFSHVDRAPRTPDPSAPVLRIVGFAMMGGVHIEMRLPGESGREAEQRRRKQQRALRSAD